MKFQLIRCNVDLLKLIQIGLTFMNGKGECAPERCTWQFNFRYDINVSPKIASYFPQINIVLKHFSLVLSLENIDR